MLRERPRETKASKTTRRILGIAYIAFGAVAVLEATTIPTVWWEELVVAGMGVALATAGLGALLTKRGVGYAGLYSVYFLAAAVVAWLLSGAAGWEGLSWVLVAIPLWLGPPVAVLWFWRRTKPSVRPPANEG